MPIILNRIISISFKLWRHFHIETRSLRVDWI